MEFIEYEKDIINLLEKTKFAVLATSNRKGIVSASLVCIVNDGLKVYIQTDKNSEKVENIKENENIALNCNEYNFKGIAKLLGHPSDNSFFIEQIKNKHMKTYINYTNLPNEILIEINIIECKIWGYKGDGDIHDREIMLKLDFINKKTERIFCEKLGE